MVSPPTTVYDPCGGLPCLDFVNSIGRPVGRPGVERLLDYADLTRWSAAAGTLTPTRARALARAGSRRPQEAAEVLDRARELREAIFRGFSALIRGRRWPTAELQTINAELALGLGHARVEPRAGGFAWTWSRAPEALDAPLWPIARSAADLLVSPDRELVKECASDTCLWLFLDRTKNHQRRWCEMKTCGNRAKVRQHRRRRRAEQRHGRAG